MSTRSQLADTVLMIAPVEFGFNEQTADDNVFQVEAKDLTSFQIREKALGEFRSAVEELRRGGIRVLDLREPVKSSQPTPDAVFPNNWISTTQSGSVIVYPMRAKNRRCEADRLNQVLEMFDKEGLLVNTVIDLRSDHPDFQDSVSSNAETTPDPQRGILEGTGSLIIDHLHGHLFVALSERAHSLELLHFVKVMTQTENWTPKIIEFNTRSSGENGKPFYHTNVVMSIGDTFAVVCLEAIEDLTERELVTSTLRNTGREVIEVDRNQAEKSFCANILQFKSSKSVDGEKVIVMSKRAKEGFERRGQLEALERHGKVVALDLDIIESVGGGSARCMLAEVFLPKK